MSTCHFCGKPLELKGRVMRVEVCPACGRDLHCCLQCRFHDPAYHNQCREPKTDPVRDRDRTNLCDYFEFAGSKGHAGGAEKDQARKRLHDLFKK